MSVAAPRQSVVVSGLAVAAVVAMVAAYFMPLWWVSLTAPNYPADAFPDGIRIFFSFTGVSNGCTTAPKTSRLMQETQQEDLGWREPDGAITEKSDPKQKPDAVLDCMHEMNTINHYVGMHPIGVGAPVERVVSKYLIGFLAVALLGFAVGVRKARVALLGVGFAGVSAWMLAELFALGRLDAHVKEYIEEAGKYFREPERIASWGNTLHTTVVVVAIGLVVVMAAFVLASWRWERFQLVLGAIPAFLPVFFVGAYAAWLYFFGHNLHPWGAFTVKPFMPTVFGDGKVAQFSTHSYPLPAFGLLVLVAVLLLVAVLRRRMEFLDAEAPGSR
jgi:ABC-type sugar transport system permease subunit